MNNKILVKQKDATDCGAACMASVAAYYRLHLPISRIRQYAGTDQHGTNMLGLIEAAERLCFEAKATKGSVESLPWVPLPAIAHLQLESGLHHYAVIYKHSMKWVLIMDPAEGRLRKEKKDQFLKKWTGIILLLRPADDFTTGNRKQAVFSRFWQLAYPCRNLMLRAFAGALLYTLLGLSTSFYVQKIVDAVLTNGNLHLLNLMSVAMILFLFLQIIAGHDKSRTGIETGRYMDARLILDYLRHLLQLPQSFFDTMHAGEIISRVNDAVKIRLFINDISLNIVMNILIVSLSIAFMIFFYWKLALVVMAAVPGYLLIYWTSNRLNKKWQRRLMEKTAFFESQVIENIETAATIKSFCLEEHVQHKTESKFTGLIQSLYKSNIMNLYLADSSEFLTRLFVILMLWAGSYFVIGRHLSAGQLLSFYALTGYFTQPVLAVIGANRNMQDALIAADRLFEITDLDTEIGDGGKIELTPAMIGDVEFKHVHFRYGTRTHVFEDLNLVIRKNSTTAIIGESGSGKSTLLALLHQLYPVRKGQIIIGGVDLRYISKQSLRRLIAVVPQRIDLFAGTIAENIAPGESRPDMQKISQLGCILGIDTFVEKLPRQYDTILQGQGISLSAGQRQRLAIARALYRNPEILILDEATSALDPLSEQKVRETLSWFGQQNKTIIIIAHRLSAIKNCDDIVLLKEGRVAESGTHEELLNRKGYYAALWAI